MVHPEKGEGYRGYAVRVGICAVSGCRRRTLRGPDQLLSYLNVINIAEAQA